MNTHILPHGKTNGNRIVKAIFRLMVAAITISFGTLTASAATASLSKDDVDFLKTAYQGGLYEIEIGKYAVNSGKADDVKALGQMLVTDHTAFNQKLADFAAKNNVTLDTEPGPTTKTKVSTMTVLSGGAFDKVFVPEVKRAHHSDIKAFRKESEATSNADLKALIKDVLPTLRNHLKMAQAAKTS